MKVNLDPFCSTLSSSFLGASKSSKAHPQNRVHECEAHFYREKPAENTRHDASPPSSGRLHIIHRYVASRNPKRACNIVAFPDNVTFPENQTV